MPASFGDFEQSGAGTVPIGGTVPDGTQEAFARSSATRSQLTMLSTNALT